MRFLLLKKGWVLFAGIVALTILVFTACRKQFGIDGQASAEIQAAARSYMNKIVTSEQSLLALPYSQLRRYSNMRIFSRIQKLEKELIWSKAQAFTANGVSYLIVPTDSDIKPFKNQQFEGFRSLVFYKNASGFVNMFIVEGICKQGNQFNGKQMEIAKAAFEKKYFGQTTGIVGIDVYVLVYDRYYKRKASYQLSNGQVDDGKIILQNQLQSNTRSAVSVNTVSRRLNTIGITSCSVCTTWYLVVYWYDPRTGDIIDAITLDQWDVCTTTGNPYGGGPGGSGTPGSSSSNAISITNDITDPCLHGVADRLSSSMNNIVHNVISEYGTAQYNFNYSSRGAYPNPSQYADTDPNVDFNWSTNKWDINISIYDGFFSGASKETSGAAILHELLHGALLANGEAWDNLLQHNEIAENYRSMIENALIDTFGMPAGDAAALSWEGLGDSDLWKSLQPSEQLNIININNAYRTRTNGVGTGC